MQIYLGVTPRDHTAALRQGIGLARIAYRIGPNSSLLRQETLGAARGGLFAISGRDFPAVEEPIRVAEAVLRECRRRSYQGVLLDFEGEPRQDLLTVAQQILEKSNLPLYLPESWSQQAGGSIPLVCTAVSGGSFERYLREKADQYHGRLALDVERLRMDFTIPAPSGAGTPLSSADFQQLLNREKPSVYFSPDLCARYFTYQQEGVTHFVLFDDADTLSRKLQLGQSFGFQAAFLMWPEVKDLARLLL